MADIRLSKIIRQYNIGLDILVDFLRRQGVEVEVNPNAKVSDELLPAIDKQFGKDLELKQAADKVDVKITEIIEKSNKRRSRDVEEEEDEPEHETIIKSNTFFNPKPEQETVQSRAEEPEAPAEQIPEPAEEAAVVEPEPAVEPAPAVPEPEESVEEPEEEETPAPAPEAEEAPAPEDVLPAESETESSGETEPEDYPEWVQPSGSHDAYNTGDIVRYNGVLYRSKIDGNTWAPDAYPDGWEVYDG